MSYFPPISTVFIFRALELMGKDLGWFGYAFFMELQICP